MGNKQKSLKETYSNAVKIIEKTVLQVALPRKKQNKENTKVLSWQTSI